MSNIKDLFKKSDEVEKELDSLAEDLEEVDKVVKESKLSDDDSADEYQEVIDEIKKEVEDIEL